jgi:FAD synthase
MEWVQENKKLAVIAGTGAFDPIHYGHLKMFDDAKKYLEQQGYQVIKGYISPKHEGYVSGKKPDALDIQTRINLIKLFFKDKGISWIEVFDWESKQNSPMGKQHVIRKLQQMHPEAEVFYVSGNDYYNGVPCPSIEYDNYYKFNIVIVDKYTSSTNIRKALDMKDYATLNANLSPSVVAELLKIWGEKKKFKVAEAIKYYLNRA